MDTFFEQIVPIGIDTKSTLKIVGIWILALALSIAIFIFLVGFLGLIVFVLMAGVIYGAYKLSAMLYVEYEYIVTNGTLDIDKIVAKSSRQRMASFEISEIDVIEKYNPNAQVTGFSQVIVACHPNDPEAYKMVVVKQGKGKMMIVFAPNKKIKGAIVKALPRFVANSAFKD